jgi:hypothetical protein
MTRDELKKFFRALLATVAAGIVAWLLAKLGIHITVPTPSLK